MVTTIKSRHFRCECAVKKAIISKHRKCNRTKATKCVLGVKINSFFGIETLDNDISYIVCSNISDSLKSYKAPKKKEYIGDTSSVLPNSLTANTMMTSNSSITEVELLKKQEEIDKLQLQVANLTQQLKMLVENQASDLNPIQQPRPSQGVVISANSIAPVAQIVLNQMCLTNNNLHENEHGGRGITAIKNEMKGKICRIQGCNRNGLQVKKRGGDFNEFCKESVHHQVDMSC